MHGAINFSISNEFYKICDNLGINFNLLRKNMIVDMKEIKISQTGLLRDHVYMRYL